MKNLLIAALCAVSTYAFAQVKNTSVDVTKQDYERMIRNANNMDFRTYVLESLDLTAEQIKEFDPLYRSYMDEKQKLAQKKVKLMEEFVEEVAEDDSAKNEEDDKGDFMEEYWEVEIAEMELRKDYFDKMDDKITADKAFAFFTLENIAEHGVVKQIVEKRYVPIFIEVEKPASTSVEKGTSTNVNNTTKTNAQNKYRKDIDAFSNWVIGGNGKVGLDHKYTHDGLIALAAAIDGLYMASNVNDGSISGKKQKITSIATELRKDPKSDRHADIAREAFIMAADMLKTLQQKGNFSASSQALKDMDEAARKLDPDKLMTPQADHIYNFFQKAQTAVNSMANSISWAGNQ